MPESTPEAALYTEEPGSLHPLLKGLNPVQAEAVQHFEGPLLLFAGAGSGKTRVLTHRVAYLIAVHRVSPRNILAVTFTNKAAKEMKERTAKLVGPAVARHLWVGTFHATCARLLREFGDRIGLTRDFAVYDDSDQLEVIRNCMRRLNVDDKRFTPRAILSHISRAKEKLIPPASYRHHFTGFFEDIVAGVYELYQKTLQQNGALDFDDLLTETVRLLEVDPETLMRLQERYRYILVDEYQDVNHVQYTFLKLLAARYRNLCVVGDDDQSIYQFRGANVGLILDFEHDYPDACVLKLEQNYRSTKNILEAAYGVVRHNRGRKDKKLWTEKDHGSYLTHHEAENEQEEAVWIARKVRQEVEARRRRRGDFAILYRTNAQSRALEDMLRNWSVPYRIVGGLRFYERKEIKDVISYLRVIQNPDDSVSLRRIINAPSRGIGAATFAVLEAEAVASGSSIWGVLQRIRSIPGLSLRARGKLADFVHLMAGLREESKTVTVSEITQRVIDRSGYAQSLEDEGTDEARARLDNVREIFSVTHEFEAESENASLSAFLEQVALVSDIDSMDNAADAVTLMTLHSAKGLEFPVVFLVGMEEGIFPHARSIDKQEDLEEERRLCYVGITRAMDELYFSHAARRTLFGGVQYNAPSRFLKEVPSELFHGGKRSSVSGFDPDEDEQNRERARKLWIDAPETPRDRVRRESASGYRIGQKVKHATFGTGVVLKVTGEGDDTVVEVVFPNVGPKKIMLAYARLEKLN